MPRIAEFIGFTGSLRAACLLGLLLVGIPELAHARSDARSGAAATAPKKATKPGAKVTKPSRSKATATKGAKATATKGAKATATKGAKATATKGAKVTKATASTKKGARGVKLEKVTYQVKRGDSLVKIARKFNTDVKTLRKLNRMKPGGLKAGKAIVVRISKPGSGPRRLEDGVSLPESGPGYIAPRRDRTWGTRGTVEHIQEASAAVARQFPGTVPAFIGDVSFRNGGFMPPHKSHRGGRDVDIGYFAKDNKPFTHFVAVTPETMDAEKTWAFFDAALSTGHVSAIYVDRWLHKPLRDAALKMGYDEETLSRLFETRGYEDGASRSAVIRHIRGHRDHFHLRFDCPKGEHPSS
ncbi:MAG: hypothetical protein AMXMBFR64_36330 [Myxococcales bacterium]